MVYEVTKKRSDFKSALRYICIMEFGYESDLKENVDENRLSEFRACGFLAYGKNLKRTNEEEFKEPLMESTWRALPAAKRYYHTKYGIL